jgi:hypothetical protein
MTDQQYPTTPSPKLRAYWRKIIPTNRDCGPFREDWLMDRAAKWGSHQCGTINEAQLQERADQELEGCCEWLRSKDILEPAIDALRAARRPKPPSEAEQALAELEQLKGDAYSMGMGFDAPAICRALERLTELEQLND